MDQARQPGDDGAASASAPGVTFHVVQTFDLLTWEDLRPKGPGDWAREPILDVTGWKTISFPPGPPSPPAPPGAGG